MSALVDAPRREEAAAQQPLATGPPFDAPTLDDVLSHAWEVLAAGIPAGCPVCGGELAPGAGPIGGRCESCGCALD